MDGSMGVLCHQRLSGHHAADPGGAQNRYDRLSPVPGQAVFPHRAPYAVAILIYWAVLYLPAVAIVATYLLAHVTLQEGVMRRLLVCGPLVYLGQRSYGAYLLHLLAIHLGYMAFGSATLAGGVLTTCLTLAVTIPAAELLYRMVERPGLEVARRLTTPDAMKNRRKCQELRKARSRWPNMQAKRDDLKDSFYLYIMRTSIGAGLRNQYTPNEHLPDRLAELLQELDEPEDRAAQEKRNPPRMRRHIRRG